MTDRPAGSTRPLEVGIAFVSVVEEGTTSSVSGGVIEPSDSVAASDGSMPKVEDPRLSEDNSEATEVSRRTNEVGRLVSDVLLLVLPRKHSRQGSLTKSCLGPLSRSIPKECRLQRGRDRLFTRLCRKLCHYQRTSLVVNRNKIRGKVCHTPCIWLWSVVDS